jgi:hypothetical protein
MIKKTVIISNAIFFFCIAAMTQPALELSCAMMMECVAPHSKDHSPAANENHNCTCDHSPQLSTNRHCAVLKRNLTTSDISSEPHICHVLPLRYDGWLVIQSTLHESNRAYVGIIPSPHCPIFILNQSIIC